MSLLPTAHAGQSFGARRIDFYTVSGEVAASDEGTGRITDTDGMVHDVRLLERSNALAPGDTASVLRVQAGPNRRSRPAAIINHTRGTWMRAAPDATGLLARSGVTRGFNWWLSVLALALVAIAAVWPEIHGFLSEVNGGLMASVPAFDVFAEMRTLMPALPGWRLETALPGGLLDTISALGFVPMDQLTEWGLAVGAGLLALLAFLGRSWRLVYVPALALLALTIGTILGSALATLAVVGGSLALFLLGGLVNRVRDGGRFNARVARLAEHALRNPPHEGVRPSGAAEAAVAGVTASAAIAAATAVAHGDDSADATAADAQTDISSDTAAAEANVEPGDDAHASGEAEAPSQDDLLPAAPAASADDAERTGETDAALAAAPEASGETEAATEEPAAEDDRAEQAIVDAVVVDGEMNAEPAPAATPEDEDAALPAASEDTDETVSEPVTADEGDIAAADEADDDLPSLDAVAAAAALTAVETGEQEAANAGEPAPRSTLDLDDERTMPVAPPPPMPGQDAPESVAETSPQSAPDISSPDAGQDDDLGVMGDGADTDTTTDSTATDALADIAASVTAESAPIVDDPLMDLGDDPMMSSEGRNDYAPGAPEIDLDRTPAE